MTKINNELFRVLFDSKLFGYLCDDGAFIGNEEFVLVDKDNEHYLAHISEFEQEGIFVRIKK